MRKPRGPKPTVIELTEGQQQLLEQIVRRAQSPQCLVMRAKIILKAAAGTRNQQIADELQIHVQTVRQWRQRWARESPKLKRAEAEADEKELSQLIQQVLRDEPRPGAPSTFSPEQICQIVALACESPEASGRPVSHWTPRELTDEVVSRDIVSSISRRSVGRFLKGGGLKAPLDSVLAQSPAGARPGAV